MIPQNDYNQADFELLSKKIASGDLLQTIINNITQVIKQEVIQNLGEDFTQEIVTQVKADVITPPKIRWATNRSFKNATISAGSAMYDEDSNSVGGTTFSGSTTIGNHGRITIPGKSTLHLITRNYAPDYISNGKAVKFSGVSARGVAAGALQFEYVGNGAINIFNPTTRDLWINSNDIIMEGIMYDFSYSNEIDPNSGWTFGGDV